MNDLLKRRGIFKVSAACIRENPEAVQKALNDALIVGVANDFMTDTLTYKGYSQYFRPTETTEDAPQYFAEIKTVDGEAKVTWKEIKE